MENWRKKMKTKKYKVILSILLITLLTGCSLASPKTERKDEKKQLVGVVVTFEHLDNTASARIENIQDGKLRIDDKTINYVGLKFTMKDESSVAYEGTEGIQDVELTYNMIDNEDKRNVEKQVSLEGSFYIAPLADISTLYVNPVYEDDEGGITVEAGNGINFKEAQGEGVIWTTTFNDEVTINDNQQRTSVNSTIKLNLVVMYPPEKIFFHEMDKNSTLILSQELDLSGNIKELTPSPDTEYIIVETHKRNENNEIIRSREQFDKKNATLHFMSVRHDGICKVNDITLNWEDSQILN